MSDIPMPDRMKALPFDPVKRLPVPWFVAWIDGKPEWRIADGGKFAEATSRKACWVCGDTLGRQVAFVIGPMCTVNRIAGDPPSHRECAIYSAKVCPFLTRPAMERREDGLPDGLKEPGGVMLQHNPGVCAIWVTRSFELVGLHSGWLFNLGDPTEVLWYAAGQPANLQQVTEGLALGCLKLRPIASAESPEAEAQFDRQLEAARKWFPKP